MEEQEHLFVFSSCGDSFQTTIISLYCVPPL